MATMGSLHAVVLENVRGILEKTKQGPSFMDVVLEEVRRAVPHFDWQVAVLRAQDFRLAQKRTRVFLRGLRRCFGEVPNPLAPMGEMPLEGFLKPNLPPVNRSSVTACIRRNLKDAERELLQKWDSGELSAEDIICFPADRASGKTYARVYQKNMVPTLTTAGMYLFLVSVGCLRKPDDKRRYFRFLDSTERLTLQGFKKDVLASSPDCLRRKAAGNAYPVPLVAAVLAPMLQQLSQPDLQSELDRAPEKSSVKAALAAQRFEEALASRSTAAAACNREVQATRMQQQPKKASQTRSAAASKPQPKKRRANKWIKSSSSS
ncbi:mthTIM [Symbiodinium sp. CCMP2592]|nr:mthTIM [Symbiodinium sp. CCMP2592]